MGSRVLLAVCLLLVVGPAGAAADHASGGELLSVDDDSDRDRMREDRAPRWHASAVEAEENADVDGAGDDAPVVERRRVVVARFDGNAAAEVISTLEDVVTESFGRSPQLEVLGEKDIIRLLDLEAQKQLMGCDGGSCAAEIGAALGAEYVVIGRVNKVGRLYVARISLMRVADAHIVEQILVTEAELAPLSEKTDHGSELLMLTSAGRNVPRSAFERLSAVPEAKTPAWVAPTLWASSGLIALGAVSLLVSGAATVVGLAAMRIPSLPATAEDKVLMRETARVVIYTPLAVGLTLAASGTAGLVAVFLVGEDAE